MKLVAVGDISLGDFPLTLGFGVRSILEKTGRELFGNEIKEIFKNSDFCFGNLETVISDIDYNPHILKSAQMRGAAEAGRLLANGGFNILSVANNHSMQHKADSFTDTLNRLRYLNIVPIGVANSDGLTTPHFGKVRGETICFLGYSLRPEKYNNPPLYSIGTREKIIQDIKSYRNKCDYICISLHWGDEFVEFPSVNQKKIARDFVDAGAKIIIGHHPHIVQGVEIYNGGVIAYSLGNFIFDFWQKRLRNSMILEITLNRGDVENFVIYPVRINRNYVPEVLHGKDSEKQLKKYIELSEKINISTETKYRKNVRIRLLENKIQNRIYFLLNMHRYKHVILKQNVVNFFYNRFNP